MRSHILNEIEQLDAVLDHERIVYLTSCFEFPFDMTRALEFALFRTYCVPSISALLAHTGEFEARPQKRYDDTDIIVSELLEHGYSSERGTRAIMRMNQLHGRFKIANDDFKYVLSTFVFEPIRWIDRFGWRRLSETERLAMFRFWREVGMRMKIADLPEDYQEFEGFNRAYERARFSYKETNRRIGTATVELFASWYPRIVAPLVRRSIYALLDEPVRSAFGFPEASPVLRRLVPWALKARGRVAGWFPTRGAPRLRSDLTRPTYPSGYTIEDLGPPGG